MSEFFSTCHAEQREPSWRGEPKSKHFAFPHASDIDLLGRLDVAHDDRPVTVFDVFVVQRCQQRERTPGQVSIAAFPRGNTRSLKSGRCPIQRVARWLGEKKRGIAARDM